LFSLGSVLYAMCTGHAPFRASGTMAVLKRVIEDRPRPVRDLNPDVPGWLDAIVLKLLAKDPDDRFQTAAEVGQLLEQHLAHLRQPDQVPMPARIRSPDSAPRRPRRRSGVGPLVIVLVLVFGSLFLCVIGVPLAWIFWRAEPGSSGQAGMGPTVVHQQSMAGPLPGPAVEMKMVVPGDREVLEGTWRAVTGQIDDRPATAEELKQVLLVFRGDRIRVAGPTAAGDGEAEYRLNLATGPKQLTILPVNGVDQEAIFRFDNERLIICIAPPGGSRPTSFATQAGSGQIMLTLKRDPQ